MSSYEELLKRAKESLPKNIESRARFEMPEIRIVAGKQTSIKNFSEISKALRREPKHVAKFLFKTLAIPGDIRNTELILQGKINSNLIKQRLKEYMEEYVLCHECGKVDTLLTKKDKVIVLKCEACGARKTMKGV